MSERQLRLVLDVNVLLDNYLPARPHHKDAKKLVALALERDALLLYPITALPDFFFIAQASVKRAMREERGELTEGDALIARKLAWAFVDNLEQIATAVAADESDRWLASKERVAHPDLEDNLIVAAAQRCDADFLITNDTQLIAHALVACSDVQTMIARLESSR